MLRLQSDFMHPSLLELAITSSFSGVAEAMTRLPLPRQGIPTAPLKRQ